MQDLFACKPLAVASLHLWDLGTHLRTRSMAWLEDYVAQNMSIYQEGGVPAVTLQESTPVTGPSRPETIAAMSALGRFIRREFPDVVLGVILQAHDPYGPLAVACAVEAAFVRIKVFVGAMLKAGGIQEGCGIRATEYRANLNRADIKILADVYDRTGYPLVEAPLESAANWAVKAGADGLVLTGSTFEESLQFLTRVRKAGITRPLFLGGSANEANVAQALAYADGIIVSTSLRRAGAQAGDLIQWDRDKVRRFMDAVRAAAK